MFCDRDHQGFFPLFPWAFRSLAFHQSQAISAASLLASFSVGQCTAASAAPPQHQSCHSGQDIYTCLIVHMMMPGQPQQ